MKRYGYGLLGSLVFLMVVAPRLGAVPMVSVTSRHYVVQSDGNSADATLLSRELEVRFKHYNSIFHFNEDALRRPLKVRAYTAQEDYDAYISEHLGRTSSGAVYMHYNQPDRRELVIHRGSAEAERMFPHQAFVQYLRAFIPQPPAWLREGFAIYFSTLYYESIPSAALEEVEVPGDAAGGVIYEENLAWLETVKDLGDKAPALESVFLADVQGFPAYLQSVSWSLVSFFRDSNRSYYERILYECFMLLSSTASSPANAEVLFRHILSWTDLETLEADYRMYLESRKTFAELIIDGQQAYKDKDFPTAEAVFQQALRQRYTHYAPHYYLGLLAYDQKQYDLAERYYRSALQYGADPALVAYAQGVNAASAGRNSEAIEFLEQAGAIAPAQYKDQTDLLIKRLR
ncbi:MAG: tetratricopeptide repeat protein [Spirochaetaceae bacterium]|jgi:tetratricopeptide (TPR) repeat protein|nr:tetratricopeptide repeat protein [Spirochaetaceae bacterium]